MKTSIYYEDYQEAIANLIDLRNKGFGADLTKHWSNGVRMYAVTFWLVDRTTIRGKESVHGMV